MSKYYLLSDNDESLTAVCPNKRGRNYDYSLETSINIQSQIAEEQWVSAGDESYFRISKLPDIMYLHNSRSFERFAPLYIHEVDVKNDENLLDDEVGHHDGASSFSLYEGKYANSVLITKTYDMSRQDDLDQLIALGFFEDEEGSLFRGKNLRAYFEWLVANHHQELFIHLYDIEPYFSIINDVVIENQPELLEHMLAKEFDVEDEIFNIDFAFEHAAENGMGEMLEILLPYTSNTLESLTTGLLAAVDASNQELANSFLEKLTKEGGRREIFDAVHYATPKEKLHLFKDFYFQIFFAIDLDEWNELMVLALTCESDELLSQIFSNEESSLGINMDKVTELTRHIENEVKNNNFELKDMVEQGNIIACQAILKSNTSADLDSCLLIAAEKGFLGIVKNLIEYGADAKTWMNYPIKFANKHNYSEMKKHLLELGVPDESFK